jgi:regulator of sigma E protease
MEFTDGLYGFGLPFLVLLTALVFVHEMGHYLIARYNGVRVEVFSVGFGPEIFGWTDKAGTRWKFSLIPLGGYVKMFGDADAASTPSKDAAEMSEADRAVAFPHKRLGQRVWIVAGGPLANFLFAIVIFAGFFMTYGQPFTPPVVGEVLPESAAEAAGFEPQDRILAIDGDSLERFEELQVIVAGRAGERMEILVDRGGEQLVLVATPRATRIDDGLGGSQEIGRLGISRSGSEFVRLDPLTAVWRGGAETWSLSVRILNAVGEIIIGDRSAKELGGPLLIAQVSGQVAEDGILNFIQLVALVSINLGLINLFPIPMLDGGHLLYYAIEAVRGRPLGERAQEFGFRIGLALVLSLFLFVTWNDLVRLDIVDFVKGLVT